MGVVGIDAKGTHSAQLSRVEDDGFTVRPSSILEYTPKLARSAGIEPAYDGFPIRDRSVAWPFGYEQKKLVEVIGIDARGTHSAR